jgi:cysteine desulfurase family protein (TIGR01976 family)
MNTPLTAADFPLDWCRRQFPALQRELGGRPVAFFDGPSGSQVPRPVIEAVSHYLANTNANRGGLYATSRESDALLDEAHRVLADFLGALAPEGIVFGANMTSLTFALSRALARTWKPQDEIIVTRLDHDANVTPWVLAARDAGAIVHYVRIRPDDCTLDLDDLRSKLGARTRLVAVGAASNIVGTINPLGEIARLVHDAGALLFVDAVHYAPHLLPDVLAWQCDFAACSAYKFFGPHVGVLWSRPEMLNSITPYKLRPVTETLPGRWMVGTQNHEGIVGAAAAVEYLALLGRQVSGSPEAVSRRGALQAAFRAIRGHEQALGAKLLAGLCDLPQTRVLGIIDPRRWEQRVPTFALTHGRLSPAELAERLGRDGVFVGHGNFYALQVTESLGLEPDGVLRAGIMHYTSAADVDRLLAALGELG